MFLVFLGSEMVKEHFICSGLEEYNKEMGLSLCKKN